MLTEVIVEIMYDSKSNEIGRIYELVLDSPSRRIARTILKRTEKIITARKIMEISYQNSNAGYASPETKGLMNIRDNNGINIREDKGSDFFWSMI